MKIGLFSKQKAPGNPGNSGPRTLYPGKVEPETFEVISEHLIERYFKEPSHFAIEGKPYFSVYGWGRWSTVSGRGGRQGRGWSGFEPGAWRRVYLGCT